MHIWHIYAYLQGAETDEVRAQLVSKARAAAVEVAKSWVHKHDPSASLRWPQPP